MTPSSDSKVLLVLTVVQGFLFGAGSMNAFWHPSLINLVTLPCMAGFTVHAIFTALRARSSTTSDLGGGG